MIKEEAEKLRKLMKEAHDMDGSWEDAYQLLMEGIHKIIWDCEE